MKWPDIQGWMQQEELDWLYETAKTMDSIVEIGSWKGRSTYALLSGCKGPVYAVDHWYVYRDDFQQMLKSLDVMDAPRDWVPQDPCISIYEDFLDNVGKFKNLKPMRMVSKEAVKDFKKDSVDMIWIDGAHPYEHIMSDLETWYPIKHKLLCGHDIYMDSVVKALKDFGIRYKIPAGWIWVENQDAEREVN